MKFVSFVTRTGTLAPGLLEGESIRRIDAPSMREYIALPAEKRAASHTEDTVAIRDARLAAPVQPLRNIFCVGRNYLEHAKEGAAIFGKEVKLPDVPTFFTKATPTTIAAHEQTLELEAKISSEYDFEAELAVIIGAECKDVHESDAMSVIFGYTAFNDVTARDLQRAHLQWFKGKSLDHCSPYGPWIVSADEIGDPSTLEIRFRLNGVEKQHSNTSKMIFSIPRVIAELSKGMTLLPGDIIATGTPEGVGFARKPPEFLKNGDVMEVEIEKIGILRNTVSIA
ncbi:MAG TPA: fumarylacetoacetate hydrolase family protein [Candidatus Baltobacteraceae bacterium]|nr:fumarylacetoacetate hydrolase family protein [Candidatus Baltobacteraceae bacterium]